MFKLIKIINSGVNVPEPVRVPKDTETVILQGCAISTQSGLAINCAPSTVPKYIALANAAKGDTEVLCYEITDGMRFETVINTKPYSYMLGTKALFAVDDDGNAFGFGTEASDVGVMTITDLCGATNAGDKITVKFN